MPQPSLVMVDGVDADEQTALLYYGNDKLLLRSSKIEY